MKYVLIAFTVFYATDIIYTGYYFNFYKKLSITQHLNAAVATTVLFIHYCQTNGLTSPELTCSKLQPMLTVQPH